MSTVTREDLAQMRELTRMTGAINNVQRKQLEMWPRVILGADDVAINVNTQDFTIEVDVSNVDFKSIAESSTEGPVEAYERRMAVFDEACKFLLGDEYTVNVSMKGKSLKTFYPKAPPPSTHEPKFDRPGDAEAYRQIMAGKSWVGIHPKDKKG